jgi:hypothetical protein
MIELIYKTFPTLDLDAHTPEMIASEYGSQDPWKLVQDVPAWEEVKKQNKTFDLAKRAVHVLTEA